MSAFDLHRDLALRLDRLVPPEEPAADWSDVVRRARPRRRHRRLRLRAAVAVAVFLALAAIATATYIALTRTDDPRPGSLTVVNGGPGGAAQIVEVLANGKTRVLWHCPQNVFCGELVGVDWSPDGSRVAFTLDEIGGASAYVGLHILDVATGRDIHIPHVSLAHPMAPQPRSVFAQLLSQSDRRLGCRWPHSIAWSPDGTRLAYDCGEPNHEIFTIRRDGTGHRRVPTGLTSSTAPAWSPDGRRIAFAGSAANGPSAIYVMRLDGSRRVLVAHHGSAPDWSPDGNTIAYRHNRGIALVTPAGVDVSPGGTVLQANGLPAWSPDGRTIAVGTRNGVYLVARTGGHLRRATRVGVGVLGPVRPAWYPSDSVGQTRRASTECGPC